MKRMLRIGLILVAVVGLVWAVREARRPDWEVHVTGDAAARAGLALVRQGDCEKAIPALESGLAKPRLEVAQHEVFAALGRCYLEVEPDGPPELLRAKGHIYVGVAHRLQGDFEAAGAAFAEAMRVAPDDALAYESAGATAVMRGAHAEAIPLLERAVDLDGAKAVTRANLALAYAGAGRFGDADHEVEQAAHRGYSRMAELRELVGAARAGAGGGT